MKEKIVKKQNTQKDVIAVIGLGYVGYPLALAFSRFYDVIGFDTNIKRIKELCEGFDSNTQEYITPPTNLQYSSESSTLTAANIFIIAVPTPIYKDKMPNLSFLREASKIVGKVLKKDSMVIYESSTFPFCTMQFCAKILTKTSGLIINKDFYLGYSPERINPGDTQHTLKNITKLIAASTPEAVQKMQSLYSSIIDSLYIAPSIEVAEMAKLVENVQRDLNIAFVNEVAIMCDKLGLNAYEVLQAARSKWNFLPFEPGLVGGHCISIDPYYLAYILKVFSYKPKILTMGRLVNESMPKFLAHKIYSLALERGLNPQESKIVILGLSFKADCRDIRNSKTPILRKKLKKKGFKVKVYDPLVDIRYVRKTFGFTPLQSLEGKKFHIVIVVNAHKCFMNLDVTPYLQPQHIVFDMKHILSYATHRL